MTGHELPPTDFPDDRDHPSLVWLKEQWELGNTKKLEEMVALWNVFELFGKVGRWLRRAAILLGKVLVWFSGLVAAWWIIAEGYGRLMAGGK